MYEQEDSCIEQEDLMTEYMVYPEYENKILFRVAPSSRRYRPSARIFFLSCTFMIFSITCHWLSVVLVEYIFNWFISKHLLNEINILEKMVVPLRSGIRHLCVAMERHLCRSQRLVYRYKRIFRRLRVLRHVHSYQSTSWIFFANQERATTNNAK